jgi:carboxymethylenebutenolidase
MAGLAVGRSGPGVFDRPMHSEMVDVPVDGGVAEAYRVQPDGPGPHPGVLVFHDAFGLRQRLFEMAGRIAAEGYTVLAPNMYHRGGASPLAGLSGVVTEDRLPAIFERIGPLNRALTPAAIADDTRAYLSFMVPANGFDAGPVAIAGYCQGGTYALRAATAFPDRIQALGSFHAGAVVTAAEDSPHRAVGRITGEVYFGHADDDPWMTPEQIATLEAALAAAGVTHRSEVYAEAEHGFTLADLPVYDEAADRRHQESLSALLDRALRSH